MYHMRLVPRRQICSESVLLLFCLASSIRRGMVHVPKCIQSSPSEHYMPFTCRQASRLHLTNRKRQGAEQCEDSLVHGARQEGQLGQLAKVRSVQLILRCRASSVSSTAYQFPMNSAGLRA